MSWANILPTHLGQVATPQLTPERFACTATTAPGATGPLPVPPISSHGSPAWRSSPMPRPTENGGNRDCPSFCSQLQRILVLHGVAFVCPVLSCRFPPPAAHGRLLHNSQEAENSAKTTDMRLARCRQESSRSPALQRFLVPDTDRGQCGAGRWSSLWRDAPWKSSCGRLRALRALIERGAY